MEVCEGSDASCEGDMGIFNADAIFTLCRTGGDLSIAMERSEHFGVGNAEVRASVCSC